jgi:hypothetical protein
VSLWVVRREIRTGWEKMKRDMVRIQGEEEEEEAMPA